MKVQVLQEDLSKILNTSIRFINTRQSLPVLANFMLIAEKTKLKVQATNLEMSISINIGAKVEEEGRITVPAKSFVETVSNLNQGQLTLNLSKEKLKIESVGFTANILTTPANDFPKIPETMDSKSSFSIPGKTLLPSLSKILFATSTDESRPVLGGVLFVFKGDSLTLVASDGFRLSRKNISLAKKIETNEMIVPKAILLEIIKAGNEEGDIFFEPRKEDNQLVIKVGDTIMSTRLIEGNFPDFEKIIPKSWTTKVLIDKNDLKRGVKLSSIFARESANVVKLSVQENAVELSSESGKVGKENYKTEAKVEGPSVEISYNYKFIEDFINMVDSNDLEIKLTDASSATIFADPKDPDFLHLIMPVRVQN